MELCGFAFGRREQRARVQMTPSAASVGWVGGFPRRRGSGRRRSWQRRRQEGRRSQKFGGLSETVAGTDRAAAAGRAEAGPAPGMLSSALPAAAASHTASHVSLPLFFFFLTSARGGAATARPLTSPHPARPRPGRGEGGRRREPALAGPRVASAEAGRGRRRTGRGTGRGTGRPPSQPSPLEPPGTPPRRGGGGPAAMPSLGESARDSAATHGDWAEAPRRRVSKRGPREVRRKGPSMDRSLALPSYSGLVL